MPHIPSEDMDMTTETVTQNNSGNNGAGEVIQTPKKIWITAFIFAFFNIIYYLIISNFDIWQLFQKVISILSFFSIVSMLLYLCRTLTKKSVRLNLFIFSLVSVLIFQVWCFYYMFMSNNQDKVMIGVSSVNEIKNVYNNIIPLTLFVDVQRYQILAEQSLIMNLIVTIISILILFSLKNKKINW